MNNLRSSLGILEDEEAAPEVDLAPLQIQDLRSSGAGER
jgi:hypothetical protein